MAFNMSTVFSGLEGAVSGAGNKIASQMNNMDPDNINQMDMMKLQMEVSKWQMMSSTQSNVMKALADGMKGTIQNLR